MLALYRWLLYLYPSGYRREFAQEMISVYCELKRCLAIGFLPRSRFYAREFTGVLLGAAQERLCAVCRPPNLFPRFTMQPQFRFPRSAVFMMIVIFAGTVLAIAKATSVQLAYGETAGSVWPSLVSILVSMVLLMSGTAAIGWAILHALRRTGVHRLANVQTWPQQK